MPSRHIHSQSRIKFSIDIPVIKKKNLQKRPKGIYPMMLHKNNLLCIYFQNLQRSWCPPQNTGEICQTEWHWLSRHFRSDLYWWDYPCCSWSQVVHLHMQEFTTYLGMYTKVPWTGQSTFQVRWYLVFLNIAFHGNTAHRYRWEIQDINSVFLTSMGLKFGVLGFFHDQSNGNHSPGAYVNFFLLKVWGWR